MCPLRIRFVVLIANMVRQEKSIERNEAYFSARMCETLRSAFAQVEINDRLFFLSRNLAQTTREESQYDFQNALELTSRLA